MEYDVSNYNRPAILADLMRPSSKTRFAVVKNVYTPADGVEVLKLLASRLVNTPAKPKGGSAVLEGSTAVAFRPFG